MLLVSPVSYKKQLMAKVLNGNSCLSKEDKMENRENCAVCLICLSDCEIQTSNSSNTEGLTKGDRIGSKLLDKHLNVIFLLRNVLELPKQRLELYLKKNGTPESWFTLCHGCSNEVTAVQRSSFEVKRNSWNYEVGKKRLEQKMKSSTGRRTDILNRALTDVFFNCRNFVINRKTVAMTSPTAKTKSWVLWDRLAKEMAQNQRAKTDCHSSTQVLPQDHNMNQGLPKSATLPDKNKNEDLQLDLDEVKEEVNHDNHNDLMKELPFTAQMNDPESDKDSSPDWAAGFVDECESGGESEANEDEGPEPVEFRPRQRKPVQKVSRQATSQGLKKCYSCNLCEDKEPMNINDFVHHVQNIHSFSHKCALCPRGFPIFRDQLVGKHWSFKHRKHLKNYAQPFRYVKVEPKLPRIPWRCPKCNQAFEAEAARDDHLKNCSEGGSSKLEKSFKCEVDSCERCCYTDADLKLHGLLEHPDIQIKKTQVRPQDQNISQVLPKSSATNNKKENEDLQLDLDEVKEEVETEVNCDNGLMEEVPATLQMHDPESEDSSPDWATDFDGESENEAQSDANEDEDPKPAEPKRRRYRMPVDIDYTQVTSQILTKCYSCSLCEGTEPMNINDFVYHVQNTHLFSHKCTLCPRGFPIFRDRLVMKHWSFKHRNHIKDYAQPFRYTKVKPTLPQIPWHCPKCNQTFEAEAVRDYHLENCSEGGSSKLEKSFKCEVDFCGRFCYTDADLKLHGLLEHRNVQISKAPKERILYRCDQCDLKVSTPLGLRTHRIRVHHLDLYKCAHCNREYLRGTQLRKHQKCCNVPKEERRFPCEFEGCDKVYFCLSSYRDHEKTHDPNFQGHPCRTCDRVFDTKKSLRQHELMLHHADKDDPNRIVRYYKECPKCRIRYNTQVQLDLHMKRCLTNSKRRSRRQRKRNFSCVLCGNKFRSTDDLEAHKKFKHSSSIQDVKVEGQTETQVGQVENTKEFEGLKSELSSEDTKVIEKSCGIPRHLIICKICGVEFPYYFQSKLDFHMAKTHGIGVEHFKCVDCNMFFSSKKKKMQHVCGQPNTTSNHFCELCGTELTSKRKLDLHFSSAHESECKFSCQICGHHFYYEKFLNQHMAREHDVGEWKCQVETCSKVFYYQQDLHAHVRNCHDEKEKDHLCPTCGKLFNTKSYLKIHVENVHVEEKTLTCELCGLAFATILYLKRHSRRCSLDKVESDNVRKRRKTLQEYEKLPYCCTECKKRFRLERQFKRHVAAMHGNKSFKCDECGKSFGHKDYLTIHKKIHNKTKSN